MQPRAPAHTASATGPCSLLQLRPQALGQGQQLLVAAGRPDEAQAHGEAAHADQGEADLRGMARGGKGGDWRRGCDGNWFDGNWNCIDGNCIDGNWFQFEVGRSSARPHRLLLPRHPLARSHACMRDWQRNWVPTPLPVQVVPLPPPFPLAPSPPTPTPLGL